jgi:hypothetical protein
MQPTILAVVVLAAMFLLAAGLLVAGDRLRDWLHRDRRSPAQRAADDDALMARLLHPQWSEVTAVTGGIPSSALLALYDDRDVLTRTHFVVPLDAGDPEWTEEEVACFQPADAVTLQDEWRTHLPHNAFPFARDIFGDLLFVELTSSGADSPVRHWFHDGGDVQTVAPSVATFHEWCKGVAASRPL